MNELSSSQLKQVKQERIAAAIAKYTKLIASSPPKAEDRANLGSLYAQQEQWEKAIACYQQAIEIDPNLAVAYRNLAKIFNQLGNSQKASDYLFKALKLDPDSVQAKEHYGLGTYIESQGKLERAAVCFRQAIKLQPDFFPAYRSLGELLTASGKEQQAMNIYRQGVRQNPKIPQFHFLLGQALAAREEWQQAGQYYQHALELDPSLSDCYFHWGVALFKENNWSQALQCHQQAIELKPNYWEAYHQVGIILQQQQQWAEASAAYQQVRAINPNFLPALIRLAEVQRRSGKYQLALEGYIQAIEQAPESSLMEQEALAGYQKTVATHPAPTATMYYQLGKLLRAKGQFPGAIAAYQRSIELDPTFKPPYFDIQYTSVAADELEQLVEFYRQIVQQHPQIALAWGNLGDVLTQQDKLTQAIDCYRISCYQKTVNLYPQLAELEWKERKENGPDFIIAGASKCGTSSLHYYLSHHPQILLPHKKEIDFFWKNYDRGLDWYLAHFPTITDRVDFITGEATPNYLRFQVVAERIKQCFPKTKIIILLRNPIDRAVSWHYHKVNTGLTTGSFADALSAEIEQLKNFSESDFVNISFRNPDNILSSLYIYKIKAWIDILGRQQFLILKSEEFYENPAPVMKRVFTFLGLSNVPMSQYPKINAGSYNAVDAKLRKTLADYFEPYNRQLEEYLGIEFNWH